MSVRLQIWLIFLVPVAIVGALVGLGWTIPIPHLGRDYVLKVMLPDATSKNNAINTLQVRGNLANMLHNLFNKISLRKFGFIITKLMQLFPVACLAAKPKQS